MAITFMVERCMRQVRAMVTRSVINKTVETVSEDPTRTSDSKAAATAQNSDEVHMAGWERVCEAYHARRGRESREQVQLLQEVCCEPVVKLSTLRAAALQCGIGADELASAIDFLHASG
eukprot:2513062-Rhodomonas_salina.1